MKFERIENIITSKKFIFWGSLAVLSSVCAVFFLHRDYCYWDAPFDHQLLGNLGDFLAGILGCLLSAVSVLMVIRTLDDQRSISRDQQEITRESNVIAKASHELAEVQRFKDVFFELLSIYKDLQKELSIKVRDDSSNYGYATHSGKDFFEFSMAKLKEEYKTPRSQNGMQMRARNDFMTFYLEHQRILGSYFRTLYRIYDLIEHSNIDTKIKKEYLKIMRAQLSSGELFFLRYNGMTEYGDPFVKYINKYNVLKHLNVTDLLEFKVWQSKIPADKMSSVDILYHTLAHEVTRCINRKRPHFDSSRDRKKPRKYEFHISNIDNRTLKIVLRIDRRKHNLLKEYSFLNDLSNKDIMTLMKWFARYLFIYRNYRRYNDSRTTGIKASQLTTAEGVEVLICEVSAQGQKPLRLRHSDFDPQPVA